MIYTVPVILQKMRQQSNQNPVVRTMPAAVEASFVDDAQDFLTDKILAIRPDMLSHYFDLTTTGAVQYYIPDSIPFNYESILKVEDVTSAASTTAQTGLDTTPTMWQDRLSYSLNLIAPYWQPFSIRDQFIEFPEKPSGNIYRVWYTRRPVGLFYGAVGDTCSSTTVVFPTTPTSGTRMPLDDYYNGMYVSVSNEVKRVSDYVNSTVTATIEGTWTTTPTKTTSEVSIISSLPTRLHSLIPTVGAKMIRGTVNDDELQGIMILIEETYNEYIGRLAHSQQQLGEQIRRIPR